MACIRFCRMYEIIHGGIDMHRTPGEVYTWTEKRRVLTDVELQIPGIRLFGWSHNASPHPLGTHIHKGALELVYVVSGSQHYIVENEGEYDVKGNQVFLAQPNVAHGTGGELHDRYEIFWVQIEKELCPNFLGMNWENGMYLQSRLLMLENRVLRPQQNLHPMFARSLELLAEDDFFSQMHGSILLQECLCELVRTENHQESLSEDIASAVAYIKENVLENILLEQLAEQSGLSLSGFKQKFRREMGVPPREFINVAKVEKSRQLLSQGYSVTQTAFMLGFSSSNYFATIFRKFTGQTPSEYIRKNIAFDTIG